MAGTTIGRARQKKQGLLLLAIGVIVPLLLLLATTGYKPGAGFLANIYGLRIPIHDPVAIPYRFPLAFCIFLIFLGIRRLEPSKIDVDGDGSAS